MLGPAKEEFTKWANDKAEGDRLPPNYARVPLQFISADQPKALWHLVPVNFDPKYPSHSASGKGHRRRSKGRQVWPTQCRKHWCMIGLFVLVVRSTCLREPLESLKMQQFPGDRVDLGTVFKNAMS